MTHTQTILRCDGCRVAFLPLAESRNSERTDAAIRALREKARVKGWQRYRATPTASLGDYCPECQKAQAAIRARIPRRTPQ